MATEKDGLETQGVLSEDVVASNTVQERDGSYHITIPKDSARDLGIQKGDNLLFTGEAGDDQLALAKPQRFLQSSD